METQSRMMPWQLVVAYYGPTDTRGARHKVTSGDSGKGARYFPYDYANPAHEVVCAQYMAAEGWAPDLYRVDHVAAYIVNGRRHTFYSVTRLEVES